MLCTVVITHYCFCISLYKQLLQHLQAHFDGFSALGNQLFAVCRSVDVGALLQDCAELIDGPISCQQFKDTNLMLQAELCRVLVWFAKRAKARGDTCCAGNTLAILHTVLATRAHTNPQMRLSPAAQSALAAAVWLAGGTVMIGPKSLTALPTIGVSGCLWLGCICVCFLFCWNHIRVALG